MSGPGQTAALEIVANLPATPLLVVPGETVALVAKLTKAGNSVAIIDAATADAAGKLLVELTAIDKLIEARRVEVKAPFLDLGRKIDDAVKPHAQSINVATSKLRTALANWQRQEEKRVADEERARQAELARLEQERKDAEQKAAAAQTQAAAGDDLAEFDIVAADIQQARVEEAQANLASARQIVTAAKPAGVTYRTTLKAELSDMNKLPPKYVLFSPNMELVRANHCVGWKEGDPIPVVGGIKFTVEKTTVVSTRR